ncbi:MAG: NUDIX hydrolase [Spongiibacteraceae bacterium]|jgi:8-oxo-dGTP pyrophosphatase MutT (NUDIX family)
MSKVFPAATVVLIRDAAEGLETLLLKRSKALSFGADTWVFPGGKIDAVDYGDQFESVEVAARRGAVREALEETNLPIAEQDMHYFSHWTTPEGFSKRFSTWFFICEFGDHDRTVSVDGSEIVAHRWCTPTQALADHRAGLLSFMPPAFVTLTELLGCSTVADALAMYRNRPVQQIHPKAVVTESGRIMLYPNDIAYQGGDYEQAGPRHRLSIEGGVWCYECLP